MKRIFISQVKLADHSSCYTRQTKHSVFLGNGSTHSFTNIKEAKAFIAGTNRFLNEKLFELNELYIEVFTHYQRNWFYLDNNEDFKKISGKCLNNFADINRTMTIAYTRSGYTNGNYFVFKHFYNIMNALTKILEFLIIYQKRRGNYAESKLMTVIINRIKYIKKTMDIYPEEY